MARGLVILHDMINQPNFNPATQNNRGDWSLRDVSSGMVFPGIDGKPVCINHGAMNCVVSDMSIWRCLMCGRAAYVTTELVAEDFGAPLLQAGYVTEEDSKGNWIVRIADGLDGGREKL